MSERRRQRCCRVRGTLVNDCVVDESGCGSEDDLGKYESHVWKRALRELVDLDEKAWVLLAALHALQECLSKLSGDL